MKRMNQSSQRNILGMLIFNLKIRSFSLIEMLVVLILSGIISGIVFFCFFTVTTYEINLSRKLDNVNDATILYSNLTKDIKRCQLLRVDNNFLRCTYSENSRMVSYEFFPEYVIRKQIDRLDTFACLSDVPYYTFQGKELIKRKGYADSVSIQIAHADRMLPFTVRKVYDRATLLQIASNQMDQWVE
jgi:prepilin-type N-terminal cleavage/methylation domain-containing protein